MSNAWLKAIKFLTNKGDWARLAQKLLVRLRRRVKCSITIGLMQFIRPVRGLAIGSPISMNALQWYSQITTWLETNDIIPQT